MWEARAEYADGTTIERLFDYDESMGEAEQIYRLEEWLISRHDNCTWYSVNYDRSWDYDD